MKLNYEQLIKALDAGEVVEVRDTRDNTFACLGVCGKDKDGDYRYSGWCNSIEESREYKGDFYGYSPETLKEICDDLEYLDSYAWAITDPIPVGTKVYVKPNAKEECRRFNFGWKEEKREMIEKIIEVKEDHVIVLKQDGTYVRKRIVDEHEYEDMVTKKMVKKLSENL